MTLRVVVDGRGLGGYSATRGIGRYLRGILAGLATEPELEFGVLAVSGSTIPAGASAISMRRIAPGRWAAREHDLMLPFDIARSRADVFWSPSTDPPRWCRRPWIQTLHDLIPLQLPGFPEERERWLRSRERLARAAQIVTPSRFSADSAIELLGLDPARISVAPHGVDAEFRPAGQDTRDPSSPYLLYVGEFGEHKGYAEVMRVIALVAEAGLPHRLRIAGRIAPWVRPKVDALVASSPRPDLVDVQGYVDDLPALYRGADALCVTSRFEGFGFPAAEAMACGTPVVSFDNSSLPEVVGDGGTLVPDGDIESFAAAVIPVAGEPAVRAAAAERAVRRGACFTWDESVRVHRDAFLRAAGG